MIRERSCVRLLALLAALAAAMPAGAQAKKKDRERDVERAADQLGRAVERVVDDAMKTVDRTLRNLNDHRFDDYQYGGERIDTTFAFSRSGTIDLTSISGDIVVTGWSRAEARIRAQTERGRLRWNFSSSRISIETESMRGRTGETRYEVSIPEGVRVILRSTSGDISAKGTKGAVDANTTSGDITVSDATGRVSIENISGDIIASGLSGEVDVSTVSGDVSLEDVDARSLHVESTSGELGLSNVRSKDVSASTVSGEVTYRGTIESGGQYEFHSHSGTITLNIPANASARFSIETFSGELDSAFPVTLQPSGERKRGRRLEFTVGGGDARVIAETFSGDVEIRRDSRR